MLFTWFNSSSFSSNDPTSSVELCNLYCRIQFYSGRICSQEITPTLTITTPTTTTTTTTTLTSITEASASTSASEQSCPNYNVSETDQPLFCALWIHLLAVETIFNSSTSFVTPLPQFTSCIYRWDRIIFNSVIKEQHGMWKSYVLHCAID